MNDHAFAMSARVGSPSAISNKGMLMTTVIPIATEEMLQRLAERKAEGRDYELAQRAAFDKDMTPEWRAEMHRKIDQLSREASSPRSKLPKLYALMEEVGDLRGPHMACSAGCGACCRTVAIEISDLEAQHIAAAIGRPAKTFPPGMQPKVIGTTGKVDMPCPFLKNESCSIYPYRPFNCRSVAVLGKDELLCSVENTLLTRAGDPRAVPVPMTKMEAFNPLYLQLTKRPGTAYADIRQFFPEPE